MSRIETRNAKITSTMLGIEEHGIPTAFVHLDYGGSGQGFGGYGLSGEYMHRFVTRVLEVVGAREWEELPGKSVRAKMEHSKVHAIGHYLEDRWFSPGEEFNNE